MDIFKELLEDELEIECQVRGLNKNSETWANSLKDLLTKEETDPSLKPTRTHATDVVKELQLCKEFSETLSKYLKDPEISNNIGRLKTLEARVKHWYERTARLKGTFHQDNEVDLLINKWRRLRALILSYVDTILNSTPHEPVEKTGKKSTQLPTVTTDKVTHTTLSTPIMYPSVPTTTFANVNTFDTKHDSHPHPNFQLPSSFNPVINPPIYTRPISSIPSYPWYEELDPTNHQSNSNCYGQCGKRDVKWNIKFSGSPQGLDISDFLFRLEAYAEMDKIPLSELTSILPKLLQDTAEKWYWVFRKKHPYAKYEQLKHSLIIQFSSSESDRQLRKIIQTRLQRNKESFSEYLLEIESLNSRLLNPFSQLELLEIIRSNMDPALQNVTLTMHFTSTEQLCEICRKYERLWFRTGHDPRLLGENRMAKRNYLNEVDFREKEELDSTQELTEPSVYLNELRNVPKSSFTRTKPQEFKDDTYVICWNCKDMGHRYQNCSIPTKGIFCYGCGRSNILKPQCPNCNKIQYRENYPSAGNDAGGSRPSKNYAYPKISSILKPADVTDTNQ